MLKRVVKTHLLARPKKSYFLADPEEYLITEIDTRLTELAEEGWDVENAKIWTTEFFVFATMPNKKVK
jgi:hypothetical protein